MNSQKKRGRPKGSTNSSTRYCLVCGEIRETQQSAISCSKCMLIDKDDRYKTMDEQHKFHSLPPVNQFLNTSTMCLGL